MHPLKEQRILKHLSQQELADLSNVSIRTIQRIENGVSTGSPYVIKALCKALGSDPESIIPAIKVANLSNEPVAIAPEGDIVTPHLKHINYSTLLLLAVPYSNLVLPFILYMVYKKSLISIGDKKAALKILSFQVLWCALSLTCIIFIPFIFYITTNITETFGAPVFLWIYLVFVTGHIAATFHTAYQLNNGKEILPYIPMIL